MIIFVWLVAKTKNILIHLLLNVKNAVVNVEIAQDHIQINVNLVILMMDFYKAHNAFKIVVMDIFHFQTHSIFAKNATKIAKLVKIQEIITVVLLVIINISILKDSV